MNLSDRQWSAFSLGNTDIFNLHSTLNGIDKNKLNLSGKNTFPYVTRTDKNNGVTNFIPKQSKGINPGNTISIGLDTQTVFYQPKPYYTGQNIQILSFQEINIKTAIFLIPLIKKQLENLNWGGNGATLSRLKAKKILLPTTSKNQPDWQFMEDFVSEKREDHTIPSLKTSVVKPLSLNDRKWSAFFIKDIFTSSRGKRIIKSKQSKGNNAYISSTARNNGIDAFIATPSQKYRRFNKFIGVNNSGSVGKVFYHHYSAIVSDHVTSLKNNELNLYTGIFVTTIIEKSLNKKFSFNHEISDKLLNSQKIMLPVDSKGKPDWQFMEEYIQSLPNAKLL